MTPTAILLIVIAAIGHAIWNLIAKREHPSAAFFLVANAIGAFALCPILFWKRDLLSLITPSVWLVLLSTGFFLATYYVALAGAYRSGHLSLAYPLARSSPIIVVTLSAFVLGHGSQISARCIVGILFVVSGCFLLPMQRFSDFKIRNYWNPCCLLALIAALGTTGYTLLDDHGLRLLRETPARLSALDSTLLYAPLEALIGVGWLGLFVLFYPKERRLLGGVLKTGAGRAAVMGVTIYGSYLLVLGSMAFVTNVSYVAAFRQLSVPIGAVMGFMILREPNPPPKILGLVIVCVGLLLVGLG